MQKRKAHYNSYVCAAIRDFNIDASKTIWPYLFLVGKGKCFLQTSY
uniref:Uncharacterized protein n=1 Tax=Rhizophora mucronata TaxID=61149 RepID=A0A2P2N0I4_RHIMU